MGKLYSEITPAFEALIRKQKIYFTGTAAPEGRVNVSPKGIDTFRILAPDRVMWLNLTGSGNETAAHLLESPRITIMFCMFEGKPHIIRLYGQGRVIHPTDTEWKKYIGLFPDIPGARQLIDVKVDSVQGSCGYAVPLMEYKGERNEFINWAEKLGPEKMEEYKRKNNSLSLDGKPTGLQ